MAKKNGPIEESSKHDCNIDMERTKDYGKDGTETLEEKI